MRAVGNIDSYPATLRQKSFFVSLKSKQDIQKLFKKSKTYFADAFLIKYVQVDADSALPLKVVWAVSKKVGGATKRNLARRRLKEALYAQLKKRATLAGNSLHLAVLPAPRIFDFKQSQLEEGFAKFLNKVYAASK